LDIEAIRRERREWLTWKNIIPRQESLKALPHFKAIKVRLGDVIAIEIADATPKDIAHIEALAKINIPWRKGPFAINELFIDTEWQSSIKYNLLKPHFNLKDKLVGDIGCNNGYYLFRMIEEQPKKIGGI
jgi:tRNA (mo5U34)-methyltransferase